LDVPPCAALPLCKTIPSNLRVTSLENTCHGGRRAHFESGIFRVCRGLPHLRRSHVLGCCRVRPCERTTPQVGEQSLSGAAAVTLKQFRSHPSPNQTTAPLTAQNQRGVFRSDSRQLLFSQLLSLSCSLGR